MIEYITVAPAYGRDYKSKSQALEAWKSGKDFEQQDVFRTGTYCSIRDFKDKQVTVEIRYNKLRDLVIWTN